MKKNILLLVCAYSFLVIFSSCKKNQSQTGSDNSSEVSVQTDDQSRVFSETNAISDEADLVLEASSPSITGRDMNLQSIVCDATIVVDSISNPRTITITYNGTNCLGSRTRSGAVVITMASGARWKNAGAVISLTYKNVKITRVSDNKSITINGSHTVTNVSGGLLVNLSNLQSITHTITSSNMAVTFDDGSQRTWQVARQRTFTYNNGIVISVTGTHTEGSSKGIEEWGTTRYGGAFTSSIIDPIVVRQDCSFRLVSGSIKHETILASTTATFGLDASGKATSCPGTGGYYLKATWTGANGKMITIIMPY